MNTLIIFLAIFHLIAARPQSSSSGSFASSGSSGNTNGDTNTPPLNLGAGFQFPFPFGTYAGINIPGIIRLGAGCQDNGQGCNAGIQGLEFLNNLQNQLQQAQAASFQSLASQFQPQFQFPDYGNTGNFDVRSRFGNTAGGYDNPNNAGAAAYGNTAGVFDNGNNGYGHNSGNTGSNGGGAVFASSSSSSSGPNGVQSISTRIGGNTANGQPEVISTRIGGTGTNGEGVYVATGTSVDSNGKVTSYKHSGKF